MVRVLPPDVELFLTGYGRREVAARPEPYCQGVWFSNEFPDPDRPQERAVVVRSDGGPDVSIITSEVSVGVTVLAGSKLDANNLARMVKAIFTDCANNEPGNPVAACVYSSGPYAVPEESEQHRRYFTLTLAVVGSPL